MSTTPPAFLLQLALWGSVASVTGLGISALLRRRSAAMRHLVCFAFMIGMLVLPLVIWSGASISLEILPPEAPELPGERVAAEEANHGEPTIAAESNAAVTPARSRVPASSTFPLVMILYLAGILATLVPLVVGMFRLAGSLGRSRPAHKEGVAIPDGIRAVVSDETRAPFVWGWLDPVLILPKAAITWTEETLRDVVNHEIAHLERRDGLTQIVARASLALHWFNPLAWLLMKQLLLEAERASDDRVLEVGTDPAVYAERLLAIASASGRRLFSDEVAAVAMARPSQLVTRIETLLDERARHWKLPVTRIIAVIMLTSVALSAAAMMRLEPAKALASIPPSPATEDTGSERFDSGWVDAESDTLTLRPGVTALVIGKGRVFLENDKRTLRWERPVVINPGSSARPTIEVVSEDGEDLWFITPTSRDVSNVSGIKIRGDDPEASSKVESEDGIQFYLTTDRSGRGMYLQPDEAIDPDFDLDSEWNGQDGNERDSDQDWDSERNRDHHDDDQGMSADESSLYPAIRYGRVEEARRLIENGYSPNEMWDGDGTPLIVAVRNSDREMVEMLLDQGADPSLGVEGDGNSLIVAAQQGELELMKLLVNRGGEVNRGVEGDGNPLIAAARRGDIRMLEYLLEKGANIEAVVPGDENALISAAEAGRLEAVKFLVSLGADINARVRARRWDGGGMEIRTALSQATRNGHSDVVAYLKSVGARQ